MILGVLIRDRRSTGSRNFLPLMTQMATDYTDLE
jgi:hypothetical protein